MPMTAPEALLWAALAARPMSFPSKAKVRAYQMIEDEQEKRLVEWIRKNNPDSEVFVHQNPDERRLKEYGWERFPATFKGKQIWIKRKPNDNTKHRAIEVSA